MPDAQPTRVVTTSTKNVGVAILLTILFGPLGMLYSTVAGAIIMFVVGVPVGIVTAGLGLFLLWPICVLWAGIAASSYNKKLVRGQRAY